MLLFAAPMNTMSLISSWHILGCSDSMYFASTVIGNADHESPSVEYLNNFPSPSVSRVRVRNSFELIANVATKRLSLFGAGQSFNRFNGQKSCFVKGSSQFS